MLEKMDAFFEARLNGYEEHQLTGIESAREFYPFTASCLPKARIPKSWTWDAVPDWSSGSILKRFPRQKSPGSTLRRGCWKRF